MKIGKYINKLISVIYYYNNKGLELKILSDNFSAKFATIESHKYLKEDIDEIKSKLNDIHDVIMTFTVNNFKDK